MPIMRAHAHAQVTLSSQVAHEHLVQLLDVFAQGDSQLVVVVGGCVCGGGTLPDGGVVWGQGGRGA